MRYLLSLCLLLTVSLALAWTPPTHVTRGIYCAPGPLLGTGFSGEEVREPYASWIRAANRRRFEGSRGKGRGRHRKRTHERGEHERPRRTLPAKAKGAPFAVAVDVPSGLPAAT